MHVDDLGHMTYTPPYMYISMHTCILMYLHMCSAVKVCEEVCVDMSFVF